MTAPVPVRPLHDDPAWLVVGGNASAGSLERLLARSALGDEVAFAALYDATSARIYGLVLRLVRNHSIADEVTQETYLQVWRMAARYDPTRGAPMSWLTTLARRRAVDRIRTTEAISRQDTAYHQHNSSVDYDVTAETAEASMEAQWVRTALASLTVIQRQVVELTYFGGHTHAETARIMGIPLGTAKTRIRDGLMRLRSLVDEAA
ncbi:MAG: sigma-70 family RNA polymerase sigma factor [Propionibacteriales bacterium]|nr:sigma-70 family RNA polymerase sigma factor [Propionibacteriales bacterium]